MNLGNIKYGPRTDSESTFHKTKYSEFIGSPEHCALCHDEQDPYGEWVKATYREWSEGPFPGMDITCIDCHMDTTTGTAAVGGKKRDNLAVHSFMAVHSPERLEDNIEIIASVSDKQLSAVLPGNQRRHQVLVMGQNSPTALPRAHTLAGSLGYRQQR